VGNGNTHSYDSPQPSPPERGKGKNPFRDSYKPEADEKQTASPKKSNPFRDSYQEDENVPVASLVTASPVKGKGSSGKSNPFEEEQQKVNPFDVDARSDSSKSKPTSKKSSPSTTKQTVSRANPILAQQNSASGTQGAVGSSHGSELGGSSEHGRGNNYDSEEVVARSGKLSKGEPGNPIYYLNRFSDWWLLGFLVVHVGQFVLLLNVGYRALPDGAFAVVLLLAAAVVIMVLVARWMTRRSRLAEWRNIELNNGICTPNDEADVVPDTAVLLLAAAAVTEGFAFAIFSAVSSGNYQYLDTEGFYTKGTLLQVLRFTSITLLALHRTLRPANRLDPMRTVLELEVIAVCWDALDGSTLYELLDGSSDISTSTQDSVRTLMAAWYVSVGFRMALMFFTNLSPSNWLKGIFVTAPFQLAAQPTVDRTLQGLRLKYAPLCMYCSPSELLDSPLFFLSCRSIITITMALADLYAAFLRTVIWSNGHLDALQQDMCIKNYMFLSTVAASYYNFQNTSKKEW
jgi:multisubunit Na+/H+ antiporter MnhB subunit